ncbi:SAM-dependent methyltransferase [Thermoanaerobacterium sp. PSU-2]|uniref:class I SAM-dependent methyltransferase n=1 Tax=Thermoanaerobacterium sp. PSU-2 TaxID=1930849 RepID=UPI000A148FA9|nr:methyltransferase domain-containing protein [Thermoanaerobacterium sp. PSU-2]ORX23733.1 SAM-dependent methyltransferase [Thermoanaerobacterium sp. PSU-2]
MNYIEYFDSIAGEWDEIRKKYFDDDIRNIAIERSNIKNKGGLIVADIGTGSGFMALELSKYAREVVGIDVSDEMLKYAKQTAENAGINNIIFLKGSMEQIPIIDDSIDVVFSNMVLHHVENPFKGIMEIHRILKPGGMLILTDVMKHSSEWARFEMYDRWLGFNLEDIEKRLIHSNFKEILVKETGLYATAVSSKGEIAKTGIFIAKGIKE